VRHGFGADEGPAVEVVAPLVASLASALTLAQLVDGSVLARRSADALGRGEGGSDRRSEQQDRSA
jgi:hypothetical protein